MRFDRHVPAAMVAAVLLAACPGRIDDPARFTGGCDAEAQILTPTCARANCHAAQNAQAGLDLASPNFAAALVGRPASGGSGLLIDPNDPESSVLLTKVLDPPPFGSRMPLGEAALADDKVTCLRTWIEDQIAKAPPVIADAGAD